jgi:DNA invertase Pin-like site-specific DNA recombinase
MKALPMRTIIYARFSSALQNARSADDQVRLCRERCEREGWTVVAVYKDEAISGAAGTGEEARPGLNAALARIEAGEADQLLAESTDRVSRHVADAHTVRERIEYAGARLFTLFDGQVTPMIGLVKGFMDAQFRTDLAQRVRRGQQGAVRQGRSPAGVAYGYRRVLQFDANGEPVRGLREIDEEQAGIVLRIYREYVAGRSSRQIAQHLNRDGIAPPRGRLWAPTTISGHRAAGFSILSNPIYIGRIVYGRTKTAVNPVTRRRTNRLGDGQLVEQEVPHLRIVDDELWAAAQAMLEANAGGRPERRRRPKHLLSGLGECGLCGGSWVKFSTLNWKCSTHLNGGACANNRTISSRQYERRVLADLKAGMLAPEVVSAYVREYHREYARAAAQLGRDRDRVGRQLAEADRKVKRLVDAFAAGADEFVEIRELLVSARDERARLEREFASMEALPDVLALHPHLDAEYRRQVEALENALAHPEAALDAVPRLRAMIGRIIISPNPQGRGAEIRVIRRMDQVLSLAQPQRTARPA